MVIENKVADNLSRLEEGHKINDKGLPIVEYFPNEQLCAVTTMKMT